MITKIQLLSNKLARTGPADGVMKGDGATQLKLGVVVFKVLTNCLVRVIAVDEKQTDRLVDLLGSFFGGET